MLVHFVNLIDDTKPSAFTTGEAWLVRVRSIYGQMMNCEHNPLNTVSGPTHHTKCPPQSLSYLLPIDQRLQAMSRWNNIDQEGNHPACLWVIAELDQAHNIVDISPAPLTLSRSLLEDVTAWELVPSSWQQAHGGTVALVQQFVSDFGVQDTNDASEYQVDLHGGSVFCKMQA